MALGSNPSRDQIWAELASSTYRNGGVNLNHLQDMYEYVFGDTTGNYSRDAFGGTGTPTVSSLTATGGDSQIDLTFTLDNNGGESCTFVSQHWVETQDLQPSPYYELTLGSSSTEGQQNFTISNNVNNGTTYEVRVTAYNSYNNLIDSIPAPRATTGTWDWTNTDTASPQAPSLQTPALSVGYAENLNNQLDLSWSCGGNQDNLVIQYRVDGGTAENSSIQCSSGLQTTSPETIVQINEFVNDNQNVEVRAKAIASGYADSSYSQWQSCFFSSVRSCPI